ncbi:MAG TPA: F0F1 ATP synthase subunit B' [Stellaceae bacterium]|nr:F0F1 ATP synthase subunit B' [Stellaceae bacterium]
MRHLVPAKLPTQALGLAAALLAPSPPAFGAEGGMPQLDSSTFVSQVFWLAVIFIVLYLLMARVALPRLSALMARRKTRIDGDLERASKMKAEADAVMAAYQRALADARNEAQATVKEAIDRFNAEASERQRAAGEKLAAETSAAEARIAEAKTAALANLRGVAIDVARATARKLTGADVDDARAAAAVDRVMKERG